MTGPKVALVTDATYPDLTEDDLPLVAALAQRGIEATPLVWSRSAPGARDFDRVLIRSTYDYYRTPERFLDWVAAVERNRLPLENPSPVIRWNADKRYLRDLEAQGVPVAPTEWIDGNDAEAILAAAVRRGWDRAVAKPTCSAGAAHTVAFRADEGVGPLARALADSRPGTPMLVQPYLPEIASEGEWSLMFFDGSFSHAVVKRPGEGDFRVQVHHGGSITGAEPPHGAICEAERLISSLDERLLYARVDLLRHDGKLLLMELELIEPMLYFAWGEHSLDRFADAIARRVY